MKRSALIAAAGLALAAGLFAFAPARESFSQTPAPQYLPLGVAAVASGQTAAWLLDSAKGRVIYCIATFSGAPACQSAALP